MKLDRDFFLRLAQMLWGSSLTKLGSTISGVGCLALTGSLAETVISAVFASQDKPSPIPNVPTWIGFSLLFTGIAVAVLGAYWQRPINAPGPNPHDLELLARFRAVFTEGRKEYLHDLHFGSTFRSSAIDPVFEVAAWRGATFEFTDPESEKLFEVVKERSNVLASLAELKTWPHRVVPNHHTALPDNHDEWEPAPQTTANIASLNAASRSLIEAIDAFERRARVAMPAPSTASN